MLDRDAEERARGRRPWPVVLRDLGNEDPPSPGGPEACLNCMWELAVQAWLLTGAPLPDHERANMPIRLVPRSDAS